MINIIRTIANKFGVDGAIIFTILERVLQVSSGVITLVIVARYLTEVEQGYYYTFGSILAIQIFFELGLSNIIIQYVAHEMAYLKWTSTTSFEGSEEASSRLSSLLRFSIKWFSLIGIFLVICLIFFGFSFFYTYGKSNEDIDWQIPWIILSFSTTINLMISPILAFIEGLGRIKEIAKVRLFQQIIQLTLVFVFFSLDFKLYSSPMAAIIAVSIIPLWIVISDKRKLLKFIWNKIGVWKINYKKEIFPFQWKIALSWMSGYFIFQLFNPVVFATEGPILAGQMGMTLGVLNAILMFPLSWISTKVPIFSGFIAKKQYQNLDELFNKTLRQSTIVNIILLVLFFTFIFIIRHYNLKFNNKYLGDRFLPYLPLLLMMITVAFNHVISSWATYMRCHKKEPMLLQSIVIGVLCGFSTILMGKYVGIIGITSGYVFLVFISLIWTYFIFRSKKKIWHNE